MRPRAQEYQTLYGLSVDRDRVPWYWRLLAVGSSLLILGGFLMLPATFEINPQLRISQAAVGIFAVAILTAGFSFTALVCFANRNALFQADSVFLPSLISCILGLLTVVYDFVIFKRYNWNTPALLTTIAAAVSIIVYAILLVWSQRKISMLRKLPPSVPMDQQHRDSESTLWQDRAFYENYNRNMFPTAHTAHSYSNSTPGRQASYDPNAITEDEMQRQQMLMLLFQKEQPSTPDPSSSTFRIDWQGRDEDDGGVTPANGYYAPTSAYQPASASASGSAPPAPHPGLVRQLTSELSARPWDGVWRTPARVTTSMWTRPTSREVREARRMEIEHGP